MESLSMDGDRGHLRLGLARARENGLAPATIVYDFTGNVDEPAAHV